ncbi:hypothetical protein NQ314_014651 [Rhamnusium bicolor]|uniref:Vesicle-fusing ATPase n=1 Tax=Rhamnusium bicolor TaxID=1586634 RepID=A0AAV8X1K9_9CUCU|nr:hypothetical protein NQ314_014651 [Rhamnusium bicolor]
MSFLCLRHIKVHTGGGQNFIFSIKPHPSIPRYQVGFSLPQRKWAVLSLNQDISVEQYHPDEYLSSIVLEADFMQKKTTSQEQYDTDEMAKEFLYAFPNQTFTVGQQLAFAFKDKKLLLLVVKDIEAVAGGAIKDGKEAKPRKAKIGQLIPNTVVQFEKAESSSLNLVGKSKGKQVRQSIINPDWDFQKMGIGGLSNEFNAIFRRAFASRVFPPEIVEQLGCKHVKGILLYGPPGTGKTLMARQIGNMLNAREPKIVNGPQILDKYVGESEANVRRLFAEAEEEEKRLLSKIDGVEQLNNILVIGMTNRRDMIDEALLRPGRLEVQVEISLPNEEGRLQILDIHTARMKRFKKICPEVDLYELACLTKNFSGAELEGLVRAAQATAMNRLIKASNKVEVDPEAIEKLLVTRLDFMHALENDIKPAFGTAQEIINQFLARGVINWGPPVTNIMEDGMLCIQQSRATDSYGLVSVLIEGPPNAGKTALAAQLAKNSDFPFVKVCSPEEMVGFTETAKCLTIRKIFDDAYRSTLSCILVDNIERLLDYGPIGPRYSNLTLQALLVLLKKQPPPGKKLLILCTTSRRQVLEEMEMLSAFTAVLHVPNLSKAEHLLSVLEASDVFSNQELKKIAHMVHGKRQTDEHVRVLKLITKLEEDGALEDPGMA